MRIGGAFGVYTSVKEAKQGGKWIWTVKQYGQVVGTGVEGSEAKAVAALKKCYADHLYKKAVSSEERGIAKWKLKQMTLKRPYLVAGLVQLLLIRADKARIEEEIASYEKALWKQDDPKRRVPLPTHHLSLKPEAAALKALGYMQISGLLDGEDGEWETRRLKKWAVDMFGEGIFGDSTADEDEDEPNDY